MDKHEPRMLELLPQQYPFRFVDEVTLYEQGRRMRASFDPAPMRSYLGGRDILPVTVLIEGLAQVAVLLTQLETRPLAPGEMPLLGKVQAEIRREAMWDQLIYYELKPERIWQRQAVYSGIVVQKDGCSLLEATLGVAITKKGSEPQ